MRRLGIAALAALTLGADPRPEDPPLCRDALAAHPDTSALEALAAEEKRLAVEARRDAREAKKRMRETLGAGPTPPAAVPAFDALMRRHDQARRDGKVLCLCRKRRDDPHREDCELLYPQVIR